MADTAAIDPGVRGMFKRPFAEQAAFFRQKLGNLLPSRTWRDVQKAQHDRGFMVAGAATADLLADLAASVDRAISEGKSLSAFRKDFDAIVDRHGWSYRGERNWRTRVIYTTNMASSYAAGRLAQLRAGKYAYWMYKHSDSVLHPRPLHVSWSGLTLPADDSWWSTHFPPNGWGCRCRVVGVRSSAAAAWMGGRMDAAPDDGTDPKTGGPAGIDEGWDYMPGDSVADTVAAMANKTRQWQYVLAKAYMRHVPETVRDLLAVAYRGLPSVADDISRYAKRVLDGRTHLDIPPYATMGLLTEKDAVRISELKGGIDVAGYDFALDADAVRHIYREHGDLKTEAGRGQRAVTVEDYARLPELLNAAESISDGGASKKTKHPVVRYEKHFGGERWILPLEVRTGRKMLVPDSLYIIRKGRLSRPYPPTP